MRSWAVASGQNKFLFQHRLAFSILSQAILVRRGTFFSNPLLGDQYQMFQENIMLKFKGYFDLLFTQLSLENNKNMLRDLLKYHSEIAITISVRPPYA